MRPFTKPALTVEAQLQLLKNRGLTFKNDDRATRFLEVVSLFRLSPYMRPFQHAGNPDHKFVPGTTFRQIVTVYRFDSALRNLVMEAVERVEVATRACISNCMSPKYGAHWYLERANFSNKYNHSRLLSELQTRLEEERENFAREKRRIQSSNATTKQKQQRLDHRLRDNYARFYAHTYDTPTLPPSWAMLEELSLGALSRLYQGIARDVDRKQIAGRFKLPQEVLGSWLHTLTFIRNICAHHSRLWNRELAVVPALPKDKNWNLPHVGAEHPLPGKRLFVVLLMLAYMMGHISPDNHWKQHLQELLEVYSGISQIAMGFYKNWQHHPIWQGIVQ